MGSWILAVADVALPLERLKEVSVFGFVINWPPIKALIPFPILGAVALAMVLTFRGWWKELEREATEERMRMVASGEADRRPLACLLITAAVLTVQEYYGGRGFFSTQLLPWFQQQEALGATWLQLAKYEELYTYGWWAVARIIGYVFVPFALWKLLFPKDVLLDMGLRFRGFFSHLWIYLGLLAAVLGPMALVATQPDFLAYYPFYKASSRSWLDFWLWQSMYWLQFLSLEMFFRGWMLGAMRKSLGSSAIFVMAVPYCMIHYGKPYLEAHGAIVAGIVLGTLAMRTKSVFGGFLVHISVAFLMDALALWSRNALPTVWLPPS